MVAKPGFLIRTWEKVCSTLKIKYKYLLNSFTGGLLSEVRIGTWPSVAPVIAAAAAAAAAVTVASVSVSTLTTTSSSFCSCPFRSLSLNKNRQALESLSLRRANCKNFKITASSESYFDLPVNLSLDSYPHIEKGVFYTHHATSKFPR